MSAVSTFVQTSAKYHASTLNRGQDREGGALANPKIGEIFLFLLYKVRR